MSAYQSSNTAEARRAECARLQAKYPGHVAMVVEAAKSSKAHLLALPRDATVAELEAAVRQALGISAAKVTLAVEGCTPAATAAVGDVADACKHADGFLYVSVRGEQAMGALLAGFAGPCLASDSGGI
ncbi:ATG8/AUT7/APG8/PAZ2, putative [Leishmania guyanensis]